MEHLNEDIAKAWVSYQERDEADLGAGGNGLSFEDPEWWSHEVLMDLVVEDPDRAFTIFDEIVARTDDKGALGLLGAGCLEDVFRTSNGNKYGPLVIDRARRDKRWRWVLGNVWTHVLGHRELAAQLETAVNELYPDGRP